MASTFNYTDEVLDFDDANNFLLMLLTTVPSVDKPQKWDFDLGQLLEIPDLLFVSDMDSVLSGLINSGSSFTADLMDEPRADFIPPAVDFEDAGQRMMSFSLVSGSDLAGSHYAGTPNGTPNTSVSSPHATPENHAKKEPTLPFSPSMYSRNITVGSDFGSDAADVLSPRLKVSSKDKVQKPAKKTKVSHNMIEKKYRTNINSKIMELRDAVPTLRIAVGKDNVRVTDLDGLAPASKLNKASVLTKATEYIKHLERKNDLMMQQISQLQTLVRDTSVNPSPQLIHRRVQQQPLAPEATLDFDFSQTPSFDTGNYAGYSEPQIQNNIPQPRPNDPLRMDSNLLLGGMATVLGGSLISGENFRGMAAVPFFPTFLSNPSALTLQVLPVVRAAVVLSGVLMMAKPVSLFFSKKDKKSQTQNVWVSWLLSSLCIQSPLPLAGTNDRVIARLLGQGEFSYYDMLKDYASLSSCEVTFENCFLQVLLGVMIVQKFPVFSKVIKGNIKWKASLLTNLDYSGEDKNLVTLSKLIKDVDGLSLFESETMIARLVNLSSGQPINKNITNGDNNGNYVDILLKSKTDIYSIILSWRILEIIYEINLGYLECLVSEVERKDSSIADVKKDINKMDEFLTRGTISPDLFEYFCLFKCVVSPESTPELFTLVKSKISHGVQKINAFYNGQELTDDEKISDDESTLGDENTSNSTARAEESLEDFTHIKNQRSIIYSTNLMNEEKFIALVSSTFFYYSEKQGNHDPLEQLRFLSFKDSKVPLSLLSFTCLFKVLCLAVKENEKGDDEEESASDIDAVSSSVLDSLIKLIRIWLNDENKEQFLSHTLRSELTDIAVSKGMVLNE